MGHRVIRITEPEGRCISGDFPAHSSYRVTGEAAAMGQAAGVCAALSARGEMLPHEVRFADVRAVLESLGAMPATLPGQLST
jgi:hypothetical protein